MGFNHKQGGQGLVRKPDKFLPASGKYHDHKEYFNPITVLIVLILLSKIHLGLLSIRKFLNRLALPGQGFRSWKIVLESNPHNKRVNRSRGHERNIRINFLQPATMFFSGKVSVYLNFKMIDFAENTYLYQVVPAAAASCCAFCSIFWRFRFFPHLIIPRLSGSHTIIVLRSPVWIWPERSDGFQV